MDTPNNDYEKKIAELNNAISGLNERLEKKEKELDKYKGLSSRYKKSKDKIDALKRDRMILLLFSLVLIGVLCYQGYKINKAKVEQENMYKMYKKKNEEGPNQDIYVDPL